MIFNEEQLHETVGIIQIFLLCMWLAAYTSYTCRHLRWVIKWVGHLFHVPSFVGILSDTTNVRIWIIRMSFYNAYIQRRFNWHLILLWGESIGIYRQTDRRWSRRYQYSTHGIHIIFKWGNNYTKRPVLFKFFFHLWLASCVHFLNMSTSQVSF